jgi:DNA polymerase I
MFKNFCSFIFDILLQKFKYIVVIDFEFKQPLGNSPMVVCMVAKDIISQKTHKLWLVGKKKIDFPFPIKDTLFVGHYLAAEVNCMLQLGLEKPFYMWDTWLENKKLYNGKLIKGFGLVDCCSRYGINYPLDKEQWRDVILGDKKDRDLMFLPAYSKEDQTGILEYCEVDVVATEQLFKKQITHIEKFNNIKDSKGAARLITQTLFHSRAIGVCAQIETNGIPIDEELYDDFQKYFPAIKAKTIEEINGKYDLYVDGVFKETKFAELLKRLGLSNRWPKTPKGKYKQDEKTYEKFKSFVPEIDEIRCAQFIISARKLKGYAVGKDSRSRAALNMFGQKTGRTNVSTAINPFGCPRFARTFVHPDKNKILVYADYKSQEPHIQAKLSGDTVMLEALQSGDVYIGTAKIAKAVPPDATKKSHPVERQIYKVSLLAINYGQEAYGLAAKLGCPLYEAKTIHRNIINAFKTYNAWSEAWTSKGMQRGYFKTMYGWKFHLTFKEICNPRSIKNWPIQSHGSEMIRHAIIDADAAGFEISMCVHDALLIHMDKKGCAEKIKKLKEIMSAASEKVIKYKIPVDVKIIKKHFEQESPDKEKWDSIYKKYIDFKNEGVRL